MVLGIHDTAPYCLKGYLLITKFTVTLVFYVDNLMLAYSLILEQSLYFLQYLLLGMGGKVKISSSKQIYISNGAV